MHFEDVVGYALRPALSIAPAALWKNARGLFVLSTGRAGSTTLSRLLALSPEVQACDEPRPELLPERKAAYGQVWEDRRPFESIFGVNRSKPIALARLRRKIYAETSCRLTYFAPAIASAMPYARFVHLHRHPADVIRTGLERGWYSRHRNDRFRLEPVAGDPACELWPTWEPFAKICWYWQACHRFALRFKSSSGMGKVLTLPSSQLFDASTGAYLRVFRHLGIESPPQSEVMELLRQRRRATTSEGASIPAFEDWNDEMRSRLQEIAGETMAILGYSASAGNCPAPGEFHDERSRSVPPETVSVSVRSTVISDPTPTSQPSHGNGVAPAITNDNRVRPPLPTLIRNSIGMEFLTVATGEFTMGSRETIEELKAAFPYAKDEWFKGEHPAHTVHISRPFQLAKCLVTRAQFAEFVLDTGYRTEAERDGRGGTGWLGSTFRQKSCFTWRETGLPQLDSEPVTNVSWGDALAFCRWLSEKEGREYRLPTEAEWEYACRAGSTTRYCNGDDPEGLVDVGNGADASGQEQFAWRTRSLTASDGYEYASPVGSFQPNAWGFFDMHGNVFEWCADWFDAAYYLGSPQDSPKGPATGSRRVMRGGGWRNSAFRCRAAYREHAIPSYRSNDVGFRIAYN
jgi:formylglycine-generating enzyme required for sulfatase activity